MNIQQKILTSFTIVTVLLFVSIVSVFLFHVSSVSEYKKISNTLVLENTLTKSVNETIEAYNSVSLAAQSEERVQLYNEKRQKINETFRVLDSAIVNSDSKVAYQGLKNIITSILYDLEKGMVSLRSGDIVSSSEYFKASLEKKSFVESNVNLLVLKELEYLDTVQQDIEKTYIFQLFIVGAWTLFVVFLSIVFAFVFSKKLTSPIKELFVITEQVTKGNYHLEIPEKLLKEKDEVGSLATSFDVMLKTLNLKINQAEAGNLVVAEAQKHTAERNADLEKAQMATANLLEDLEEEKHAVERKVLDRTEDLERERQKLLQVTENMKGGGILLDTARNVIFTNRVARNLLGEPVGNKNFKIEVFFEFFKNKKIQEYFERCVAGESFNVPEIEGQGKVYEIFFHYLQSSNDDVKDAEGYFILMFDITDAKLLERSKSELVAVASHQLRTPLTAMRGNVEMLVDESYGPLNKEQHELLSDIDISTIRLITMVNDMLDITKIEKDDLEMSLENINVKEILDSILSDLSDYASRHQFKIICHGLSDTATVYADKMRIRQVIQNLVDNAIKYSRHPGQLNITFNDADQFIQLAFKDNGIGVPVIEQGKLFGRFYRASNTAKTSSSGSGLGLYIVRSIVRQLGGDIWFESEENVGTSFFVTFPKQPISTKK